MIYGRGQHGGTCSGSEGRSKGRHRLARGKPRVGIESGTTATILRDDKAITMTEQNASEFERLLALIRNPETRTLDVLSRAVAIAAKRRILCRMGRHKWKQTDALIYCLNYPNFGFSPLQFATRLYFQCERCGKHDQRWNKDIRGYKQAPVLWE